jgi:transposase InsO family protein
MQFYGNDIALTYADLEHFGVSQSHAKSGVSRGKKSWQAVKLAGTTHVLYSTIPARTRAKLPAEATLRQQLQQADVQSEAAQAQAAQAQLWQAIQHAYHHRQAHFREHYLAEQLSLKLVDQLAPAAAVFELAYNFYQQPAKGPLPYGYRNKEPFYQDWMQQAGELGNPYCRYQNRNYLFRKFREAKQNGIVGVVRPRRLGNRNGAKMTDWHRAVAEAYFAAPIKYKVPQVHELLNEAARRRGKQEVNYHTLKNYLAKPEVQNRTWSTRYGMKHYRDWRKPYNVRTGPLFAGDVWELDGTRANFMYKDAAGKIQFADWLLVIDGHSLAIIGFAVCPNENALHIRKALKMATAVTGYLPYELVTDNSSAVQDQETTALLQRMTGQVAQAHPEISNYKHGINRRAEVGNARDKRIERTFQTIQNYASGRYANYLGEGITSSRPNARPAPEYLEAVRKNASEQVPDWEGLQRQIIDIVNHYNRYIPARQEAQRSPLDCLKASATPNVTECGPLNQALLFWERRRIKVRNGLIRLQVEKLEYPYQLSDYEALKALNGQYVYAFYDPADLSKIQVWTCEGTQEGGYAPGRYVAEVPQLTPVHSARANQTEADREQMAQQREMKRQLTRAQNQEIEQLTAQADVSEEDLSITLPYAQKHDKNDAESEQLRRLYEEENGLTHSEEAPARPLQLATAYAKENNEQPNQGLGYSLYDSKEDGARRLDLEASTDDDYE